MCSIVSASPTYIDKQNIILFAAMYAGYVAFMNGASLFLHIL